MDSQVQEIHADMKAAWEDVDPEIRRLLSTGKNGIESSTQQTPISALVRVNVQFREALTGGATRSLGPDINMELCFDISSDPRLAKRGVLLGTVASKALMESSPSVENPRKSVWKLTAAGWRLLSLTGASSEELSQCFSTFEGYRYLKQNAYSARGVFIRNHKMTVNVNGSQMGTGSHRSRIKPPFEDVYVTVTLKDRVGTR